MILPNLFWTFQNIAYAAMGDRDRDILFVGNELAVLNDGSITVRSYVRDNSGTLNIKLYDNNGQLCAIEDWTEEMAAELEGTEYEGSTIAGCSVNYSDPETQRLDGYYLLIYHVYQELYIPEKKDVFTKIIIII